MLRMHLRVFSDKPNDGQYKTSVVQDVKYMINSPLEMFKIKNKNFLGVLLQTFMAWSLMVEKIKSR